jgi:hypothetical protein
MQRRDSVVVVVVEELEYLFFQATAIPVTTLAHVSNVHEERFSCHTIKGCAR